MAKNDAYEQSMVGAFDMATFKKCFIIRVDEEGSLTSAMYDCGTWVVRPYLTTNQPYLLQSKHSGHLARFISEDSPIVKDLCKLYEINPKLPITHFKEYWVSNRYSRG